MSLDRKFENTSYHSDGRRMPASSTTDYNSSNDIRADGDGEGHDDDSEEE